MVKRATPPTKSSTQRLSETARHVVIPDGIKTTGWPAVRDTLAALDITFDGWQEGAGRLILGKRADGLYAADACVMSIPRQVGKTFVVGWIIFALCIIQPNTTVIWTAHRSKTASETFDSMRAMSLRPRMRPHVDPDNGIRTSNGDQSIRFRNGSRILFGARERGFGRGFTKVDVLVFDEAQILSTNAIDDMVPATNHSPNPLILHMGTPPKPSDPSEVFSQYRAEALSGESTDTLYIEFSADRDCDPLDRRQWAKANPSYPDRTTARAILRMKKNLSAASFVREALGVWDEAAIGRVIERSKWNDRRNNLPPDATTPPTAIAVDMSHDRVISIAGAWRDDEDDTTHVELLAVDETADTQIVVDWLASRARKRIPVAIDSASPAAALIPALRARRVNVVVTSAPDMGKACGGFYDAVLEGRLFHAAQAHLDDALDGARKRPIGRAGAWGWDRADADVNIAPLVAATLAHYAAGLKRKRKTPTGQGRRATVS